MIGYSWVNVPSVWITRRTVFALLLIWTTAPQLSEGAEEFKCPEQFGYYADEGDCSKYFVCVFGDALHESCTGGLYFSVELQTCDWPRNVECAGSASKKSTPAPSRKDEGFGSQRRGSSGSRRGSSGGRQVSETTRPRQRYRPTTTTSTTTSTTTTTQAPQTTTRRFPTTFPEYQTLYDEEQRKRTQQQQQQQQHQDSQESEEEEGDEDDDDVSEDDSGSTEAPEDHEAAPVTPSLEEPRKRKQPSQRGPLSNSYDPQQPQYDEAVPSVVDSDGQIHVSDGGRPDKFIGSPRQQQGQKQDSGTLSVFVKPLYRNTGDQKDKESDQVFKRDQTAILAAPNPRDIEDEIVPVVYTNTNNGRPGALDANRKDVVLVTYPRDQSRYQYNGGYNNQDEDDFRAFLERQRQQLPNPQREPNVQKVPSDSSIRPSSRGRNRDARYYPRNQQQSLLSQIPPPPPIQTTQLRPPVTQTYVYETKYPPKLEPATQAPTKAPTYPAYHDYDHNYNLQSEYAYPDEDEAYRATTTTPRPTRRIKYKTTTPTTTTTRATTTTTTTQKPTRRPPPKGFSRPGTKPPQFTTPAPPPARPRNLYATPTPLETASRCEARKCRLPDCHCGGTDVPGELPNHETPQVVLVTFDDGVNDLNFDHYTEIFDTGRKNPNGCPIRGTFYVSHEWTDYGQVQTLYSKGHEMASHTVT